MKISKRVKVTLAILAGIFLLLGSYFFLSLPPFLDPVYSHVTTQHYQQILNGKWNTYNNKELNITFEYPSEWEVRQTNVTFCKPGKGLLILPKNPAPRSSLVICKAPNIDTSETIANSFDTVKKIETSYKTFFSSMYSNNDKAIFVKDVIAEDKTIKIEIHVPYPSDQGQSIVGARDKVILRLLNSVRDSK